MFFKRYRKGVFAVVYRRDKLLRYLVLRRRLHWKGWEFIKGGLEKGEKGIDAVKREVEEETGLDVLKIESYGKKGKYRYSKDLEDRRNFKGQTFELFSVLVGKGKVKVDKKEHSGFRWCGFKDAMKLLSWDNQKECLKIVDEELRK